MENFEYFEPKTVQEAVGLLVKYKRAAKLLAEGTDLMLGMKEGFVQPRYLINLKTIKGLDKIAYSKKGGISIGSLTTWTAILSSGAILEHYPILREAASLIGGYQIRNRGTIGGNICHASPSADSAPALMVYGAQCVVSGPRRERVIPIEEIFSGVQKTSLKPGEILTGFRIPPPDPQSKGCYLKFSPRKAMDLPIVGVGALAIEVEVDARTGKVEIVQVVAAQDVGLAINPLGIKCQIEGGVHMGLGYALTEEIMLDPTGRMVNDHLVDYKILTPLDMPPVESIIVEPIDPIGPFGAKGVGEMATIGTPEAISAAIHDAARVWIKDPPFTPEKVWMALKKKEEGPLSSKDVAPGPANRP